MNPRRPPALFTFIGLATALLALVCTLLLVTWAERAAARFQLGAIALLSLLLTEALWYVRPWVGKVVDAWALACTAIALYVTLEATWSAYAPDDLSTITITVLTFVAAPCALIRWYVRHQAAALGVAPATWDMVMLRRILARLL